MYITNNFDFIDVLTFNSDLTIAILQDIFNNKDVNCSQHVKDLNRDQFRFLKLLYLYQSLITCDKSTEIKIEGIKALTHNRDISISHINLKSDIESQTKSISKMFKEKDENINIDIRNALAHGRIAIGVDSNTNQDFIALIVNRSHWDSKSFQQTIKDSKTSFISYDDDRTILLYEKDILRFLKNFKNKETLSVDTSENKITNNNPCIAYSFFTKAMYLALTNKDFKLTKDDLDFIKFNSAGIHTLSLFAPFFILGESILNKKELFTLEEIENYNIIRNSIIHHNVTLDIDNNKKEIFIHFIDSFKNQTKELTLSYNECLELYNHFSSKLCINNNVNSI